MNVDYLIVGQGIAGTLLSYELIKAGMSVMVMEKPEGKPIASLVAGAVINPAAGKNWKPSPDQERFIPQALVTYSKLAQLLNTPIIKETELNLFHQSDDKQNDIQTKLHIVEEEGHLKAVFNYKFGVAQFRPLYLVDSAALITKWQQYLVTINSFQLEEFEHTVLEQSPTGIAYKDIHAKKIIFCEGAAARKNHLFASLPFTKNRGEALLLSIPYLAETAIYHQGDIRLVPKGNGLFWCGSNYQWTFDNLLPNGDWRIGVEKQLNKWLKVPYTVVAHQVAERPTTAGQFPLIGAHPRFPSSVYILNGLGTRGFSAGPFWAKELAQLIADEQYEMKHYDYRRFRKFFL